MQQLKKVAFLFALSILTLWTACQKESGQKADNALAAVPINTTVVTAFDVPTLMEKANFEAIQSMDFYRFFKEKAQTESDLLAAVMTNPENSGVDLTQNAYLSVELNPDNPEEIYMGVIFNLASAEDFSNFAHSLPDARISTENGYQVADLTESLQVAWNDKVAVVAMGEGIYETEGVVDAFFAPNEANNLAQNKNLQKVLAQSHDVTAWLTSNALAQSSNAKLLLSLAKIPPEALNDNFIHGSVDFEQGKVQAQLDFLFQEALVEDLRLLFKGQSETDFSPYIDQQNLNIYLSAALDFDGLRQALVKRSQIKMFADFALKSYGLSIQKLKDALDGDVVFTTYTGNINNRQEALVGFKLNQKTAFLSLLEMAEEKEYVTKTGKGRYLINPNFSNAISNIVPFDIGTSFDNQLIIKEDIAFISGNISRLDAIEMGDISPTDRVSQDVLELTEANTLALFADFNSLKRLGIPWTPAMDKLMWNINGKGSNFELTMRQEEVNSLQAIFEAVNDEFLKDKAQKQPVSQEKS
ncbi:MAG: DUF4836 family protein [Bacteroidota bacterium]